MNEIVLGLNSTRFRYMWVLRENSCQEQVVLGSDHGITVPWCNQLDVLCHPSVGGFLMHCGWNSMLEGLYAGKPMLTFPLLFDQFPNSKLIVEDLKVGMRVKKKQVFGGEESLVGREEIAKLVTMVMDLDGEVSRRLRARVKEIKGKCCAALKEGGSSISNLDVFIDRVRGHGI